MIENMSGSSGIQKKKDRGEPICYWCRYHVIASQLGSGKGGGERFRVYLD